MQHLAMEIYNNCMEAKTALKHQSPPEISTLIAAAKVTIFSESIVEIEFDSSHAATEVLSDYIRSVENQRKAEHTLSALPTYLEANIQAQFNTNKGRIELCGFAKNQLRFTMRNGAPLSSETLNWLKQVGADSLK